MTRVFRWIGDHPLSDWRWPAAMAMVMLVACVLVALWSITSTQTVLVGKIKARGEQSLCQQSVETEFEKAVGHALTVDRNDIGAVERVREEIEAAVAKLEHVDVLCPTP